jgi:hypothetical protein
MEQMRARTTPDYFASGSVPLTCTVSDTMRRNRPSHRPHSSSQNLIACGKDDSSPQSFTRYAMRYSMAMPIIAR